MVGVLVRDDDRVHGLIGTWSWRLASVPLPASIHTRVPSHDNR